MVWEVSTEGVDVSCIVRISSNWQETKLAGERSWHTAVDGWRKRQRKLGRGRRYSQLRLHIYSKKVGYLF